MNPYVVFHNNHTDKVFSGMNTHVSLQMCRPNKWLPTLLAWIGFPSCMSAHVLQNHHLFFHNNHMNMVFLLTGTCLVKLEARINDFPHCSHEYGFPLAVWVRMWIVKFEARANDIPHCSHEYGFPPIWICIHVFSQAWSPSKWFTPLLAWVFSFLPYEYACASAGVMALKWLFTKFSRKLFL